MPPISEHERIKAAIGKVFSLIATIEKNLN